MRSVGAWIIISKLSNKYASYKTNYVMIEKNFTHLEIQLRLHGSQPEGFYDFSLFNIFPTIT